MAKKSTNTRTTKKNRRMAETEYVYTERERGKVAKKGTWKWVESTIPNEKQAKAIASQRDGVHRESTR